MFESSSQKLDELRGLVDSLPAKDREFANSMIDQFDRRGALSPRQWPWVSNLVDRAKAPPAASLPSTNIGAMGRVIEMFDRAREHLKHPAIVLSAGGDREYRLSIAGPSAKVPGSVTVTSERDYGGERKWYGRVLRDGTYERSRSAPDGIEAHLSRFAASPETVAAEHGKLTGRCCFCNHHLQDERSTAVGYGPVCAGRFGLTWGKK